MPDGLSGRMPPAPTQDAQVRACLFRCAVDEGWPPSVERLMGELGLAREEVEGSLDRLDDGHHLKLVPGTHRILMAFPISGVASPYQVIRPNGRRYFANCAWDAIAFHPMLEEPIQIESFCHHCGQAIQFAIHDGRPDDREGAVPIVYLGRRARDWWADIITTCANTMLFFASDEHLAAWRAIHPGETGERLSVELVLRLSEPIYRGKLALDYVRPPAERMTAVFREVKLTGPFWDL